MFGKLLVVAAVIAGAAAFFLPFLNVTVRGGMGEDAQQQTVSLSAMQMMQGVSAIEDVAGTAPAGEGFSEAQRAEMDRAIAQVRGALLIPFAPTALFLLIALFSIKRFGRALGVLALIVGILGVAGWLLLNAAASEAQAGGAGFAIGFTLLLVGSGLGFVGGIVGIARPQLPAGA